MNELVTGMNQVIKQRDDLLSAARKSLAYLQKIHLHSVYNENLITEFKAVHKALNDSIAPFPITKR